MPALEELRMSELMDRARALGAPQDFLDELMDTSEPRQALLDMLRERTTEKEEGELGELVALAMGENAPEWIQNFSSP